jgi:predicted ATPase/DNA-binding SARP family transcriptional activator
VTFPRERAVELPSHNLPLALSSFIGRGREVAEVEGLLSDRRLLTLCGPGGCGKTRLALAVARDLVEAFEGGAWWVELASISDPDLVPRALAQALGVREVPGRSPTEALVEYLEPREALVVLDNCEHLIEGCAALADALLRACPGLRLLATSREPMRVTGEASWSVPSLSLPDPQGRPTGEQLMGYEAVRLFVERATEANAGFQLTERNAPVVAGLCRKLDGIPLAIELAAARTRVLTVGQISEKLEDPLSLLTTGSRTAAPRHQTLRAALRWSHELLDEQERELLGRLSVFAGGWDLEAAEAVGTGEPVEAGRVLDLLSQLVDKSLVVVESSPLDAQALRYRMLEPVRQYALERLEQSGEAEETRRRHAAYFLALAEEAHPKLRAEVEWLERLEQENGNLRGALSWALADDEIETAARLGWELWLFWWLRNHQPEGRRWVESILQRREELPPRLRVRAMMVRGAMAYGQGDFEAIERFGEELMEVSREAGRDALAEAWAHMGPGLIALAQVDLEAAKKHLEVALPLLREAGDDGLATQTHIWLGTVLLLEGDHEGARGRFEEALALARSMGDRVTSYLALFNLAQLALADGDYDTAFSRFAEGIVPSEESGDRGNVAYILEGLGVVAGARGEAGRAARLLGASEALISDLGLRGHTYYQFDRSIYERINARARAALGEAAYEAALDEGRAMSPEQAIEYVLGTVEEPDAKPTTTTATPVAPEPPAATSEKSAQTASAEAGTSTAVGLRIFALGPASVECDGHALSPADFGYAKPRELLFYLLSYPEGRTKGQIGLDLWPEASPSRLRGNLHEALRRIRKALGRSEWIFHRGGRYAFERSLPYSFDVETFEAELGAAAGAATQEPARAIVHLEGAMALYRGEYLEDSLDWEWAMERREELGRKHRQALLTLGGLLLDEGRYEQAAEVYRRAISEDEYSEGAHRGLMRSYALMGERGRALEHYRLLVGVLGEGLGTEPAPDTRELYEELRRGEGGAR